MATAPITTGTILVENLKNTNKPLRFWQVTRKAKHTAYLRELPKRTHDTGKVTPNLTELTRPTAQGNLRSDFVTRATPYNYLYAWNGDPLPEN